MEISRQGLVDPKEPGTKIDMPLGLSILQVIDSNMDATLLVGGLAPAKASSTGCIWIRIYFLNTTFGLLLCHP